MSSNLQKGRIRANASPPRKRLLLAEYDLEFVGIHGVNTPRGCRSLLVERGPGESAREPKNRLGAIDATDFDQVGFEARFLSLETQPLALSELDRSLLQNCMAGDQQAWRQFCDRFASLILDVAEDTLRFANLSESQPQV